MTAPPQRVVAAILRNDNKVLLCHRHPDRSWYPDVWDLPGGHIEAGEDPADALVRELADELTATVLRPSHEPFRQVLDVDLEMSIWLIDYDGTVLNAAPEEHDELRWFRAEEIASLELAHDSYLDILAAALETI